MVKITMYRLIKQLYKQGLCNGKIQKKTGLSYKTIKKYLKMTEIEFEQYMKDTAYREKGFDTLKDEILSIYSANDNRKLCIASVYDYLEENHSDMPGTAGSLRNYIHYLTNTKELVYKEKSRIYGKVEELSYGKQMQLDFGEYKLPSGLKIYIFATLLSGSRFKYAAFQDRSFKTKDVILHLLDSFEYFQGIPKELVIDQDKTLVVSENRGDIIYTAQFKSFIEEMDLEMYVCRKADPESKGKIENMVKFIKTSFLNCRDFDDIRTANESLQGWLMRRANGKISQANKKVPAIEIEKERLSLRPVKASIFGKEFQIGREDRVASDKARVSFEGCYYVLPITYKNKKVQVYSTDSFLFIFDSYSGEEIVKYTLSLIKGKVITDRGIKRETSKSLELLREQTFALCDLKEWEQFLTQTFSEKTRYVRDQCVDAKKYFSVIKNSDALLKALKYCLEMKSFSISQLNDTYNHYCIEMENVTSVIILDSKAKFKSLPSIHVEKRSIDIYDERIKEAVS